MNKQPTQIKLADSSWHYINLFLMDICYCVHYAVIMLGTIRTVEHIWVTFHCENIKFGLVQPYFGHLSCMPVVCVTHYKTSKGILPILIKVFKYS